MQIKRGYNINIKEISIFLLVIYMLTVTLYVAIFNSLIIQLVILISLLLLLLLNIQINSSTLLLRRIDFFYILTIFAVLGSMHNSSFTTGEMAGPIIVCLLIIISILIRGDIENYKKSLKFMMYVGVIISLSVIFSYQFPDIYINNFLNLFRPEVYLRALNDMSLGYYAGFTSQAAITAGYIVNAIGIIWCVFLINNKKISKLNFAFMIILILGLLLTQKRAHFLFLFISCFFVYFQYTKSYVQKFANMLKSIFYISLTIIFVVLPLSFTNLGGNVLTRFIDTFSSFLAGEDISSNRLSIWQQAWTTFLENPLYGIGWGNFRETVVGTVTVRTEMEAHNIYLQLLSETGLIGMFFVLTPIIITYIHTLKKLKMVQLENSQYDKQWHFIILFSLFIQTFFLLYGLTGNPLYDFSYLVMYIISISMIYSLPKSKEKDMDNKVIFNDRKMKLN